MNIIWNINFNLLHAFWFEIAWVSSQIKTKSLQPKAESINSLANPNFHSTSQTTVALWPCPLAVSARHCIGRAGRETWGRRTGSGADRWAVSWRAAWEGVARGPCRSATRAAGAGSWGSKRPPWASCWVAQPPHSHLERRKRTFSVTVRG